MQQAIRFTDNESRGKIAQIIIDFLKKHQRNITMIVEIGSEKKYFHPTAEMIPDDKVSYVTEDTFARFEQCPEKFIQFSIGSDINGKFKEEGFIYVIGNEIVSVMDDGTISIIGNDEGSMQRICQLIAGIHE